MVIAQGDVCWADLGEPKGSAPGFERPIVVVQSDAFNRSRIRTIVCVPLTSNRKWAASPGNVVLSVRETGLPKTSVANVSQLVTLDRSVLSEAVGHLPPAKLDLVLSGIDLVLSRRGLRAVRSRDPGPAPPRSARGGELVGLRRKRGSDLVEHRHEQR